MGLREAIQDTNNPEVLDITCYGSVEPYLNLKIALDVLTIHALIDFKEDIESFQNWMTNGFNPHNLNIVSDDSSMIRFKNFYCLSGLRCHLAICCLFKIVC